MMLNQNSVRYVYSYLYIYTDLHKKSMKVKAHRGKTCRKGIIIYTPSYI